MPGILGCIERSGDCVNKKMAAEMVNSLRHEDAYIDEWIIDSCLLGAVELGFLHRSNLVYDDGKSLIGVSRGNIYNKEGLSRKFGIESAVSCSNDTRFIVELYKKEGLNFAKHFNGSFVAAIYDKEKDRVIIAIDRYGYYPMFYSFNKKRFVFASEAKAILKDQAITPKMNKTAVAEFFTFSFPLGDKTFFCDVKKMLPANILMYDRTKDQIYHEKYWDFTSKTYDQTKPFGSYLKEFKNLLKQAVGRRVKDKDEVGIFLSGGLDSRIIAAYASQTKIPIITFTFGAKNCAERKIASEVAEILGLENIFFEIPSDFIANYSEQIVYKGDGMVRIRDCHFIALLDKVRKKVDSVLLGTFGGDLSGRPGGRLSKKLVGFRKREQVIDYLSKFYSIVLPATVHKKAFTDVFFKETKGQVEKNLIRTFSEILFTLPSDISDCWEYRNREPGYIFQNSQHINWYLETQHPFLDNDLVDFFAFRFPPDLRRKEVFGEHVEDTFLQKALSLDFPVLSNIPWHGYPPDASTLTLVLILGKLFIQKKIFPMSQKLMGTKTSLMPKDFRRYEDWLRTGSKAYMLNILLDPKTLQRPFFRKDFVIKIINDHMNYKENHDQLICDLINFELLNRLFFDAVDKKNRAA